MSLKPIELSDKDVTDNNFTPEIIDILHTNNDIQIKIKQLNKLGYIPKQTTQFYLK